jgi:peptide/nickel transport system ATP-binding protein
VPAPASDLPPAPPPSGATPPPPPILEIENLKVSFHLRAGVVRAVDDLSLSVGPREVLGIVGESGSGKSVAMYSVLGLVRDPNTTISGKVRFQGRELLSLDDRAMQEIRGRDVAMIFQDPMTALTPVYTVGWQISEQIRAHEKVSKREARNRSVALLAEVGIPDPARRVDSYPHEFSGGMRQRAVIAMALSCNPKLLIADEPTTALDVTTQAQILDLMGKLQETHGSSIVLITHDMGVISEFADRVVVMYAGRPVEEGPKRDVIREPRHPYTWGLLGAVPRLASNRRRLATIPGAPVSPINIPPGCAFAPRCACRFDKCGLRPELAGTDGHRDACWLPADERGRLRLRVAESVSEPAPHPAASS